MINKGSEYTRQLFREPQLFYNLLLWIVNNFPPPARKKFLAKPSEGGAGRKRGTRERECPPRTSEIIKSQRLNFRGKKFGFCSRQTANLKTSRVAGF